MADMKLSDLNSLASPVGTDLIAGVDVSNSNDVGHWTVSEMTTFIQTGRAALASNNAYTGNNTHSGTNTFNNTTGFNNTVTLGTASTTSGTTLSDRLNFNIGQAGPASMVGLHVGGISGFLIGAPQSSTATAAQTVVTITNSVDQSTAGLELSRGSFGITQSGQGLKFPTGTSAAGVTVTSNTLDDYEEGTWTPTAQFGILLTGVTANFTKIGNIVHCVAQFVIGSQTPSNPFNQFGGLPFPASVDSPMGIWTDRTGANTGTDGFVTSNASTAFFLQDAASRTQWSTIQGDTVIINLTYRTT